jgi:hypothetical protein
MDKRSLILRSRSKGQATNNTKIARINEIIQTNLRLAKTSECTPIQACAWLEAEKMLSSDKGRPGRPLRVLLRKGLIRGAVQESPGGRWIIRRVKV